METLRTRWSFTVGWIPARALRLTGLVLAMAMLGVAALRWRSLPLDRLSRPDPGWLLAAVLAQVASLVAYALIVRRFLGIGDVTARISTLLRATVGGIAMGASLPGGQLASAAYWYRQLRREGAGRSLSAFAMVASMLAGVCSLAALVVVGIAAAGGEGPLAAMRLPILAGCGGLLAVGIAFRGRAGRLVVQLIRRLAPQLPGDYSQDGGSLCAVAVFAFANWLLDCTCLYAALAAVHASVPLQSILLTYSFAQLVAALPLLPGGGGAVEASLLLGFAAFPHGSGSLLAGVVLYRVLACWGLIPIGWLAVLSEDWHLPRSRTRLTPVLDARLAS